MKNTTVSQDLFNDLPDQVDSDPSVHQQLAKNHASVIWLGKATDANSDTGGEWVIIASDLPDGEQPGPVGWWKLRDMRFGTDPSAPKVQVWASQRLRCVPLGVRKRMIVTDATGRDHFYPQMTKASNRVEGKLKFHYQVLVMLEGISEPVVLALKGYAKTVSWQNDPGSKFGRSNFPKGVQDTLEDLAKAASKARKTNIPWLCFWIIDLCPVFVSGQPLWVDVGQGVYMNPFGLDMTVKAKGYPDGRFVGADRLAAFEEMRRDGIMDWEAQWADASKMASQGGDGESGDAATTAPVEDDEIPF